MIRVFLLSRAAFPANSRISAARYSRTAAKYTGAPDMERSVLENDGSIWLSRATHRHRHAEHSCLFARDDGHDQLGMRDQLWMSDLSMTMLVW